MAIIKLVDNNGNWMGYQVGSTVFSCIPVQKSGSRLPQKTLKTQSVIVPEELSKVLRIGLKRSCQRCSGPVHMVNKRTASGTHAALWECKLCNLLMQPHSLVLIP